MVILITGASHTGKTLLAQRILERYGYPYLSIDHLKMGLIRSGMTDLTPEDDEELTELLWPVVREIVKTAIENRQDLTVEGCYIPFGWRHDLGGDYAGSVRFVCLAFSDGYIDACFDEIAAHESDIEHRKFDTALTPESLKDDNRKTAEGFMNAGETVTMIDCGYEQTIRSVLENIL